MLFRKGNSSTPKMMPKYTNSVSNSENKKPIVASNSLDRDSLQSQQSNNQVATRNASDLFTIAIDWDPTALHLRYQSTLERVSQTQP